jgi:Ca2+-binding RTX toxin-like protein
MIYDPAKPAKTISIDFKATGSVGFGTGGADDVIYVTVNSGGLTREVMLDSRHGDFVMTDDGWEAITTGVYNGGALTSYTLNAAALFGSSEAKIDSVEVMAGFYETQQGKSVVINGSDVKMAFGYSYEDVASTDLPMTLTFKATVMDGDGDSAVSNFSLITDASTGEMSGTTDDDYIMGTSSANTIYALDGNDVVMGGGGDDIIYGGAGNDTMTGGTGADVFKWSLGDQGTSAANPAIDHITDFDVSFNGATASFSPSSGDTLDLRDLLNVAENATDLAPYLRFELVDGKLALGGDHAGGDTFEATQKIVLDNYSGTDLATVRDAFGVALGMGSPSSGHYSDADIVAKMIADGHLKTDM